MNNVLAPVYIASPFFDDQSREWVSLKERMFKGLNYPYFSPREDGINFHEATNVDVRSQLIKAIFKNNVDNLNRCERICINLSLVNNSAIDIGTLWELGYFMGYRGDIDFNQFPNSLTCQKELRPLILTWIDNLRYLGDSITYDPDSNSKTLLTCVLDESFIIDTMELTNIEFNLVNLTYTLDNIPKKLSGKLVLLTDDFPIQMFVLAGFLYAKGIPYYTASYKDYGSNIMMAASSKGHLKLPGVTDDTYRTDLK